MEKQTVRGEIKALPVGASKAFSFDRMKEGVIRNYANILSIELNGKFSVHRDHETRSFIVTRQY